MLKQTKKRRLRTRKQKSSSSKSVIFTNTNNAGFGSVLGFMLQAYVYAKKNSYPFIVKEKNWNYTYEKGWHDYFESLYAYNPRIVYPNQENYQHAQMGQVPNYTYKDYTDAMKELYRPNEYIRNAANEFIEKIGGPYNSIFIRRGDKISGKSKEMDAVNVESLIKKTGIKDGNVFVMSDDYSVVDEIKELLPNCTIFTLIDSRNSGYLAERNRNDTADIKKKNADELFTSMEVFHRGEKGWADNRSNLGRILKVRGEDKVILYPVNYRIRPDRIVSLSRQELTGDPV
jgi:hypothetical protein